MHRAQALAPADTGVTIGTVVRDRLIRPLYQPIVDLATRAVVGVEALARGPIGSDFEFPDRLFGAAIEAGLLGPLDMLCSERALEGAIGSPNEPPLLFVNAEPGVIDQPISPRLAELVSVGLPFRQVVEFTERALPAVPNSLLRVAGLIHQFGNNIALDDVGVDPMSLAFLPVLEPEVIKLDMSLVRDPESASTRTVCAIVRAEAARTGAVVIAEGIETEEDLVVARMLGARWGQGWLFGRPGPLAAATYTFDPSGVDALPAPRPGFHQPEGTPYELAVGHGTRSTANRKAVAAAMTRLRDTVAADATAVVVASAPTADLPGVPDILPELAGRGRSVILLDEPVPGEFAAAVIGPGYGLAVCVRSGPQADLITVDHLPTVAAVTRALLNRHRGH